MSDPDPRSKTAPEAEEEKKGPSLLLLYTLLGLGLLAAMAVAAMVVWPFYVRR